MTTEPRNLLAESGKPLFLGVETANRPDSPPPVRRLGDARRLAIAALAAGFATTFSVAAHHSIAGVYDEARSIGLTGVVAEFHFVNPHPVLVIEVDEPASDAGRWELEMDNRFELARIGMTADTFRRGDRVTVSGDARRNGGRMLYLRRLDRAADGLRYAQVGFTPSIEIVR
jgi:hypothetical protein